MYSLEQMLRPIFFVATFLVVGYCQQVIKADELTISDKALIEWFDSLGFPDLSDPPAVRVVVNFETRPGKQRARSTSLTGFLMKETGDEFTIFRLSGREVVFSKSGKNSKSTKSTAFELREIDQVVDDRIAEIAAGEQKSWHPFGAVTSEAFELVVLGRACAAKGFNKRAHQLFASAEERRDIGRYGNESPSLLVFLQNDQALSRIWKAFVGFGNPEVSLEDLLQQFEFIEKHFPKTKYFERATKTAGILRQMVEEQKEHAQKQIPPLEQLTGDQRVAELIYQLRTQNGRQMSQPGGCDIFNDDRKENSPAHLLVAAGFDAVPQLIEVLDDKRFTRSVGYHRDFYFSHRVSRVGQCAQLILSRISGRGFYQRTNTNGAMVKEGKSISAKEQARLWWKEIQTKGEKQVLIDAAKSGSSSQAKLLVERYPEEAAEAIKIGILKANTWGQRSMLNLLASLGEDSAVIDVLKTQLTTAEKLDDRVKAAQGLLKYEESKPYALEKLLYQWKQLKPATNEHYSFSHFAVARLAILLLRFGGTEEIKAVAKSYEQAPTDPQFDFLASLRDLHIAHVKDCDPIEKLLVDSLLVTTERVGVGGTMGRIGTAGAQRFSSPRICDMAGYVLTKHWPDNYNCRLDGTEYERDRNRIGAINHWRKEAGLEPLDSLPIFKLEPIPASRTDPLIHRVVESKSIEEGKAAFEELAGLGPGAIGAVREVSSEIEDSHPFSNQVDQMLIDMPNTITAVSLETHSDEVSKDWQEEIESLKGRVLSCDLLIKQIIKFAQERPSAGIKIKAIRDGKDNGIQLSVELATAQTHQGRWHAHCSMKLGDQILTSLSGKRTANLEDLTTEASHSRLKESMQKQLVPALAEPNKYLRLSFSLVTFR